MTARMIATPHRTRRYRKKMGSDARRRGAMLAVCASKRQVPTFRQKTSFDNIKASVRRSTRERWAASPARPHLRTGLGRIRTTAVCYEIERFDCFQVPLQQQYDRDKNANKFSKSQCIALLPAVQQQYLEFPKFLNPTNDPHHLPPRTLMMRGIWRVKGGAPTTRAVPRRQRKNDVFSAKCGCDTCMDLQVGRHVTAARSNQR